ncbi:MAG: trigger factor [Gammaproteobacteria bacterium]|nr:trigger factor [Gammaproteobacteria bacterium]
MRVSVEESGAIERKLTVSIPHAEVDREIEKRLRKVARGARIPGFRPGKAPHHIVAKRHGGQVTSEVISDTINASYREALGREDIVAAGLVSIEPKPFVSGDDLQYIATVELFPEIPSPTLAGRSIEKPVCTVTDEDIERSVEGLRKRNADFVAREGASQDGDRLTIDYAGHLDGRPFSGGAGSDHQFILGEGRMLEPFETGLRGVAAGQSRRISLTLPEDFPGADAAGKAAEFQVAVNAVERPVLPELDDAFAERLGVSDRGMAGVREQIKRSLERATAVRVREVVHARVMDELVKANPVQAPSVLVEAEIDRRVQAISQRPADRPAPAQRARDLDRELLKEGATRQVLLGLVAREVVKKAGLKADADAIRGKIAEMAGDDNEALVNWYYSEPERLQSVEGMVLEEKVVEHMLETATVVEKRVSFAELAGSVPGQ